MRIESIYPELGTAATSRPQADPPTTPPPPQNLDAERLVLSACMLPDGGAEALDDVMTVLRATDFFRDAHAILFENLCALRTAGKPTDPVAVADELERRGKLDAIGGDDGLIEIANAAPHALNAGYHAEIVRQKAQTRRLIQAATEIIRDGYSNLLTASELAESAESKIFAVRDDALEGSTTSARVVVDELMTEIQRRAQGASQGLSTGFQAIDQFIQLRPGSLIIIAARPSIGKTSLATQIAEHVAIRQDGPVLFASLEMGRVDLMERMVSSRSGVTGGQLKTAWRLSEGDKGYLASAAAAIAESLIDFTDSPRQSVGEIAAQARRMKHRGGLAMVAVDYLGLLATAASKTKTRQDEVAEMSRSLKAAARELKVPFIVLCQLNRQSESREDRRPRLADLRESGQIEQDADVVLLLHRPEFYDPNDQPGVAEVFIAKNRTGPTGAAKLKFVANCTRFEDMPPDIEIHCGNMNSDDATEPF